MYARGLNLPVPATYSDSDELRRMESLYRLHLESWPIEPGQLRLEFFLIMVTLRTAYDFRSNMRCNKARLNSSRAHRLWLRE